jgi:6-pyruvoyltetrahydropterin/6-carboxytetrahydropterin synthase
VYSICKTFYFEAAHRLIPPYEGKCNSIHGHSFEVTLAMESPELDEKGMVADFSSLQPVGEWIRSELDHAMIVSEQDGSMLEWLRKNKQKYFITTTNPTSEALAKRIFDFAITNGFAVKSVRVSETCTAAAIYRED